MASLNTEFTYDIFLSFRGEDTRYGFTGNLWKALVDRGIRTFFDDENLQKGEEITPSLLKAIDESRMAVVVLSKNYASSSFCLQELSSILDSVKAKGRSVWPVFYKVDPSDVRKLKRSYGEAMELHEARFDDNMEKLQKWKSSLHRVANLSGFHYKKGDGYEHEFIGKIVEQVLREIKPVTLPIADYLVGLDSQTQYVASLLNIGCNDRVNMLGIHGIGGIGKTTLALAVYNLIAHQFQVSCFVENVRENSEKHGLLYLQKILVFEIVGENPTELTSVRKGISVLQNVLRQKKALLILDDVDKEEQIHALAGKSDWFCLGSRVIVTTRDKGLLTCHGIESTFEMKELNQNDAYQLLIWKAFKTDDFSSGYDDVLKRAVTYASGLPLALEVIGSHLSNKTIEQCNSALDRYERIPDKKIQTILKVSFDALEEEEKSVFLDISCCFKRYQLEMVEKLLHAHHGDNKKHHIGVLVEKSLIKINESGIVTLHDLIEDMGKEIVRQESPEEPEKRSRLWFSQDIVQVLEENTGTSKIEIIYFNFVNPVEWDGEGFKKMKSLRTLIIKGGHFFASLEHLPKSLRVLELTGYFPKGITADFHPKKLTICNLFSVPVRWEYFFQKKFENMKVLNISNAVCLIQIDKISGLVNLEEFSIQNCRKLIKIDDSIGLLCKLKVLRINYCTKLRSIPPLKLDSLEKLNLEYCYDLESFPPVVDGLLNKLKIFSVKYCNRLRSIPPLKLASLENFKLEHCPNLESFPPMFGLLNKLKTLLLTCCDKLTSIPPLKLPLLEKLDLAGCNSLENFPPVVDGLLVELKVLSVSHSKMLRSIPPLLKLASLEELYIKYCDNLESLPPVMDGSLSKLKILVMEGCNNLKSIAPLKLPSLEKLDLSYCCSLENFPHVVDGLLDELKVLSVSNCKMLRCIPALLKLASLEELYLKYCDSLESLLPVMDGSLSKLKILRMEGCSNLKSIAPLKLPSLEKFDLSYCCSLENFPPVVDGLLDELKVLSISNCKMLRSIPPLLKLASLEELYIKYCDSLESLPPVMDGSLSKLKILSMEGCNSLKSIAPLKLPSLEKLDLSYCCSLESFSPVLNGLLDKLKIFRAQSCSRLRNIPRFNSASIQELNLSECPSLKSLPIMLDELHEKFHIFSIEGSFIFKSIPPYEFALPEKLDLSCRGNLVSFQELLEERENIARGKLCSCGIAHLPRGIVVVSELTKSTFKDMGGLFQRQGKGEEKVSPMPSVQVELLCLCKRYLLDESLAAGLKWLANVKELYLCENEFTILPEYIENFHFLWKLVLDKCEELREIRGIPPSLKTLSAFNCKLLTSSSKIKLLNQELHEAGSTWFRLPRAKIPDWFDYQCMAGLSITFWFRNKFPHIALCVVSPLTWDNSECPVRVIVNGNTFFYRVDKKNFMSPKVYHLHLFHMQIEKFNDNPNKALLENKWNHAEVDFGFPFQKSGIHVLKEKSSMNDIRFISPENDIITELTL